MYILALILIAEVLAWLTFWLTFRPLKRFKKSGVAKKHNEVDSARN